MTEKQCKEGRCLPKEYDGEYRCMICYREFIVAEKEDVMNQTILAPAIERIKELETENTLLKQTIEAMKKVMTAMKNPVHKDASAGISGIQHGGTG